MNDVLTAPAQAAPSDAEAAFEELYRSSRDDVFAYVSGLLRDRSAAEDVTAAAFERAYRRSSSFNPARGSMRAWLFGIARNAALDELRRRKRHVEMTGEPVAETTPAEEEAEVAMRRAALRQAHGEAFGQGARAGRPEVLRRPHDRRDRKRDLRRRAGGGNACPQNDREAEEGLR